MRGHTFDVDTPASSAVYLGQTKATQGPFAQKEAATLPVQGVKVGVDYERYIEKIRELPAGDTKLYIRSRRVPLLPTSSCHNRLLHFSAGTNEWITST